MMKTYELTRSAELKIGLFRAYFPHLEGAKRTCMESMQNNVKYKYNLRTTNECRGLLITTFMCDFIPWQLPNNTYFWRPLIGVKVNIMCRWRCEGRQGRD